MTGFVDYGPPQKRRDFIDVAFAAAQLASVLDAPGVDRNCQAVCSRCPHTGREELAA